MSNLETRRTEIAKRYGSVLFDLAQKNKNLKTILKEGSHLRRLLHEEPVGWSRLASPIIPLNKQRQMIEKIASSLKLSPLMKRFLLVVCQNRRLSSLKLILEECATQAQSAKGAIEGVLETVMKLSPKEIADIQKTLKLKLGKEISLHQVINPALLGGIVMRIGSLMIDASLKTRLNKLQDVMKG